MLTFSFHKREEKKEVTDNNSNQTKFLLFLITDVLIFIVAVAAVGEVEA